MSSTTNSEQPVGGSRQAAISNLIVRLMSEYTGRGPTKARTHITDNVVTVVLHTLTKGSAVWSRRPTGPCARNA